MNKLTLFAICSLSLALSSCGLKVTQCDVIYEIRQTHCTYIGEFKNKSFDEPLSYLNPKGTKKWSCFSNDDYMELLRLGSTETLTLCAVVDVEKDQVHCSSPSGTYETTLSSLNKWSCFFSDDLSRVERAILKAKKAKQ